MTPRSTSTIHEKRELPRAGRIRTTTMRTRKNNDDDDKKNQTRRVNPAARRIQKIERKKNAHLHTRQACVVSTRLSALSFSLCFSSSHMNITHERHPQNPDLPRTRKQKTTSTTTTRRRSRYKPNVTYPITKRVQKIEHTQPPIKTPSSCCDNVCFHALSFSLFPICKHMTRTDDHDTRKTRTTPKETR